MQGERYGYIYNFIKLEELLAVQIVCGISETYQAVEASVYLWGILWVFCHMPRWLPIFAPSCFIDLRMKQHKLHSWCVNSMFFYYINFIDNNFYL